MLKPGEFYTMTGTMRAAGAVPGKLKKAAEVRAGLLPTEILHRGCGKEVVELRNSMSQLRSIRSLFNDQRPPLPTKGMQRMCRNAGSIHAAENLAMQVEIIIRCLASRSILKNQHLLQYCTMAVTFLFFVFSIFATMIAAGSYAYAQEYMVEVVTRIDPIDPVSGMKSMHKVAVNLQDKTIRRVYVKTGTTYGIPSTRNKFSEKAIGWNACGREGFPLRCVKLQLVGQTASGVQIIPNIDYNFAIYVTEDGMAAIRGCHDGYPTYLVTVDNRTLYHFEHEPLQGLKLFGNCDVKAEGYIGGWKRS